MQLLSTEALQHLPAAILPRLVDMFGKTTPALLTDIQQHASSGDLHAMAQAAHKLKGSCVSLGAEQMAAICKELQHKGESNDASGINEYVAELTSIYPATFAEMQKL